VEVPPLATRDVSRRPFVLLGFLAIPALGLGALNLLLAHIDASHTASVRTLHDEARALVPAEARVIAEEESACVEFRSSPSCVIIVFEWSGSYESRSAAAQAVMRRGGWQPAPDRPSFVYRHRDLQAAASIKRRGSWWDELCKGKSAGALDHYERDRCLDSVSVRVM
jgi:hypothetical protein